MLLGNLPYTCAQFENETDWAKIPWKLSQVIPVAIQKSKWKGGIIMILVQLTHFLLVFGEFFAGENNESNPDAWPAWITFNMFVDEKTMKELTTQSQKSTQMFSGNFHPKFPMCLAFWGGWNFIHPTKMVQTFQKTTSRFPPENSENQAIPRLMACSRGGENPMGRLLPNVSLIEWVLMGYNTPLRMGTLCPGYTPIVPWYLSAWRWPEMTPGSIKEMYLRKFVYSSPKLSYTNLIEYIWLKFQEPKFCWALLFFKKKTHRSASAPPALCDGCMMW